jgi:hypothetical protein
MEFKEAVRVIKRICATRDECEKCELESNCLFQTVPSELDLDKAESILAKWAEEHPEKTIADDFFEMHPNAPRDDNGNPKPCAEEVGYIKECPDGVSCHDCWRRPLEEVEG